MSWRGAAGVILFALICKPEGTSQLQAQLCTSGMHLTKGGMKQLMKQDLPKPCTCQIWQYDIMSSTWQYAMHFAVIGRVWQASSTWKTTLDGQGMP